MSPWDANSGPVRRPEDALRMLDRWLEDLPPVLQLRGPGLSDDPACCLLHMAYNQLVILAVRPVFFAAVKKAFAERLTSRASSLSSHPRIGLLGRCVAAADANVRLARHTLALNHPRKLLQAGLHFIFNAAICLMLRALLDAEPRLGRRGGRGRECDLDFVVARFDEEARLGSNYGRDCAAVLRDLRVLVQRLRPGGRRKKMKRDRRDRCRRGIRSWIWDRRGRTRLSIGGCNSRRFTSSRDTRCMRSWCRGWTTTGLRMGLMGRGDV